LPADDSFRCEVLRDGQTGTVQPIGELDISTAPVLQSVCAALRRGGVRRLVVDLSGLCFIDSSGLHCILDLYGEAQLDGFSLHLIPGSHEVQRVFELSGTATVLPFLET
jgi:anti-anti-sigma factor